MLQQTLQSLLKFISDFISNHPRISCSIIGVLCALAMIAFYLGCPPEAAYYSTLSVFVLQLLIRLKLLHQMIGMPIGGFLKNVLLKILVVTAISILPLIVLLHFLREGWMDFIIVCSTSVIISLVAISFIGLTSTEREFVIKEISKVYKKVKNK